MSKQCVIRFCKNRAAGFWGLIICSLGLVSDLGVSDLPLRFASLPLFERPLPLAVVLPAFAALLPHMREATFGFASGR